MNFKKTIKKIIYNILSLIKKEHLIEFWQIKKNKLPALQSIYNFYCGFIISDFKIIDVGANVGNYSEIFLSLGAEVISVEPQKYCQNILKMRFKGNSKFKLIPSGSGSIESISKIHKSKSHTIASMNKSWIENVKKSNRFEKEEDWSDYEIIPVTTLDTIIKNNFIPDYIKIDVEGFELEVLKGLTYPINVVSFEITLPEMRQSAIECINEFDRMGAYLFTIPNQEKLIDITKWQTKSEIIAQLENINQLNSLSADIFAKRIIDLNFPQ